MRLVIVTAAALALAACGDTKPPIVQEDDDAGTLECAAGQVARFGRCYCQNDSACAADEYCEGVTGTCQKRPPVVPPDAGPETCSNGARRCAPDNRSVQECENATWTSIQDCPAEGTCAADATGYYCTQCQPGTSTCKDANTVETCKEKGDGWTTTACVNPDNGQPAPCSNGRCQVCAPGAVRCSADGKFLETCADDGSDWNRAYCSITGKCDASSGTAACVPPFCQPGSRQCKIGSATIVEICKDDGSAYDDKDCRTLDQYATQSAYCDSKINDCVDPCATAARNSSYQGCEYWASVTPNQPGESASDTAKFTGNANFGTQPNSTSEYAIVVSNANAVAAHLKVLRSVNGAEVVAPTSSTPAADASGVITLPAGSQVTIRLPWQMIDGSGQARFAYRLTSDMPVSAYQFSPVTSQVGTGNGAAYSYSNDASLLLPSHILANWYVVVAQEHITAEQDGLFGGTTSSPLPAFFSVVAAQDNTKVTVRFSAATVAGGGLAAQAIGSTKTYTLNRYDVLQFLSDQGGQKTCLDTPDYASTMGIDRLCKWSSDPTGTIISSDQPIAVFGGAQCTFKPFNRFACDHIEEQIMPFNTWGKSYVGVKTTAYQKYTPPPIWPPGGTGSWGSTGQASSPDYWRIVSGCGNTSCPNGAHITISPPPDTVLTSGRCSSPGSCTLPAVSSSTGTAPWVEFTSKQAFTVTSDQPIMLAQYFSGEDANTGSSEGDPSLVLTPPVEQWRRDYNVLASPTLVHNYLSLVGQSTTPGIKIDGKDASTFPGMTTGTLPGGYTYFQVPVSGGAHTISASAKVGVTVYGYDSYVSYGYTGGLDLTRITSINPGG